MLLKWQIKFLDIYSTIYKLVLIAQMISLSCSYQLLKKKKINVSFPSVALPTNHEENKIHMQHVYKIHP